MTAAAVAAPAVVKKTVAHISQPPLNQQSSKIRESTKQCPRYVDEFFENFDKFVNVRFAQPLREEQYEQQQPSSSSTKIQRSLLSDFEATSSSQTERQLYSSTSTVAAIPKHLKSKTSSFEWFNETRRSTCEVPQSTTITTKVTTFPLNHQEYHTRQPSLIMQPTLVSQVSRKVSPEATFTSPKTLNLNLQRLGSNLNLNNQQQQVTGTSMQSAAALYLPMRPSSSSISISSQYYNPSTVSAAGIAVGVTGKYENIFSHPKMPRKLSQFTLDTSNITNQLLNKEDAHPKTQKGEHRSFLQVSQRQRGNEVHMQQSKVEFMRKIDSQITKRNFGETFNTNVQALHEQQAAFATVMAVPSPPADSSITSTPDWSYSQVSQSTQAHTITQSGFNEISHEEIQPFKYLPIKQLQQSTVAQQLRERVRMCLANHNDKKVSMPPTQQLNNVKQTWTAKTLRRHTAQVSLASFGQGNNKEVQAALLTSAALQQV